MDLSIGIPNRTVEAWSPRYKGIIFEWDKPVATYEKEGYSSTSIKVWLHTCTHIDAPYHMSKSGNTIDKVPLESIVGEAIVFNLTQKKDGEAITPEDLEAAEQVLKNQDSSLEVKKGKILLLRTDRYRYYLSADYHYKSPYLTEDAAYWIVGKKVSAVGFDFTPEIKTPERMMEHPIHRIILGAGICQIECLRGLDRLRRPAVFLAALPILIEGAEGSLARVVAIEDLDNEG